MVIDRHAEVLQLAAQRDDAPVTAESIKAPERESLAAPGAFAGTAAVR